MDEVLIAYHHDWQREQWQSLVSAYRSSAYFEYYERDVSPVWHARHERSIERNEALLALALELLKVPAKHVLTSEYAASYPEGTLDLRSVIHPKSPFQGAKDYDEYTQVFEDRHPFTPDLSIFDLLFNMGPAASEYLLAFALEA